MGEGQQVSLSTVPPSSSSTRGVEYKGTGSTFGKHAARRKRGRGGLEEWEEESLKRCYRQAEVVHREGEEGREKLLVEGWRLVLSEWGSK